MIFIGDIHGDIGFIINYCKKYNIKNTTLIQLGDFGLGFPFESYLDGFGNKICSSKAEILNQDYKKLLQLNIFLKISNIELYIIRGNHDNPDYWTKHKTHMFSNIILVPDGSVYNIENKNILMFGGGISIDRINRIEDVSYWVDELIDFKKIEQTVTEDIDIVATHTPYINAFLSNLNTHAVDYWYSIDSNLRNDIAYERIQMEKLYQKIKEKNPNLKYWISGHLHMHQMTKILDTEFICIDICEFFNIDRK